MRYQYLAKVETYYTTYAIANTEESARNMALKSALKWLQDRAVNTDPNVHSPYTNIKQVEEELGCSSYAIPVGQAIQEY